MATALETRNIYPGEAAFADDYVLRRVQTFGSTTTFNSTDIFEIGNSDMVEAIDDVPAVAITCDTNEYASLRNLAVFANKNPDTANYINHLSFQTSEVDLYAPVIRGKYYGLDNTEVQATTATNGESPIFRTQYIENAAVNNITATYTTGGLATENFALESDNKRWFFNNGSNIVLVSGATSGTVVQPAGGANLPGALFADLDTKVPSMKGPNAQQLDSGDWALKVLVNEDGAGTWNEYTEQSVLANLASGEYFANTTGIWFKDLPAVSGQDIKVRYIAPSGGEYFSTDLTGLGGLRHGQVEVFIFDSDANRKIQLDASGIYGASGTPFWRLQSATVTVPLAREALMELGHLRPYARPLTLPVAATVAVESTDHDLELARRLSNKEGATEKEIGLEDFLKDKNLVVKVYRWNDVEREEIAGLLRRNGIANPYLTATSGITPASGALYPAGAGTPASGLAYKGKSVNAHDLYPMKVVIAKKLTPGGEAQNLAVGSNGTQTFDFRCDNAHWCLGPRADGIVQSVANVCIPTATIDVYKPFDYATI